MAIHTNSSAMIFKLVAAATLNFRTKEGRPRWERRPDNAFKAEGYAAAYFRL
jgi:hypothetical protein